MNTENIPAFVQNMPAPVQNINNVTADEAVAQKMRCNILAKRKFEADVLIENEVIADAEAELAKVFFSLSSLFHFIIFNILQII